MVAQLKAHGHVSRGWLGVEIQSVTPEIASSLGLKDAKGAIVAAVVPGGPAAKAGFEQGDIVTADQRQGGGRQSRSDPPRRAVAGRPTATFTVNRQGQAKTIKVDDRHAPGRQGRIQRRPQAQRRCRRHRPTPWAWAWPR